jgi:transposase InsO family protein
LALPSKPVTLTFFKQGVRSSRDYYTSIREYIEIFYNRQRRHSRLGYLAPAVFAQNVRQHASAA